MNRPPNRRKRCKPGVPAGYFTATEVAQNTGYNVRTIQLLASKGIIPHIQLENGWRVFGESVIETLKECGAKKARNAS